MIHSFRITNYLGESLLMELRRPETSGLIVSAVDGLGPPKATINTTEIATYDGSFFNSARAQERNIVFHLKYMWHTIIEDARHNTYKFFPLKSRVEIEVITDRRHVKTFGYVESNEPDIFSKDSGCSISVICPNSYWSELMYDTTVFSSIDAMFEFPFSNESLTESLLIMGEIVFAQEEIITYDGEVETGIMIDIIAGGETDQINIINVKTRETMHIDTDVIGQITGLLSPSGYGILTGDVIHINTNKGEKSATLTRGGIVYNIRNALGVFPPWFVLTRGDNIYAFTTETDLPTLMFSLSAYNLYEGV